MRISSLLVLIQVMRVHIAEGLEYEVRCPVAGEWHLRGSTFNCKSSEYTCLFRSRGNIYQESCDGVDYSSTGSRLIFEPYFNKALCNYKRYQPFPFSTDGSSKCVYQKSNCNEKGQYVIDKSSNKSDTTCGCYKSRGYGFVTKPKHKRYCVPSEEDCSCHKIPCNKDQTCPQDDNEITSRPSSEDNLISTFKETSLVNSFSKGSSGRAQRLHCIYAISIALGCMIIVFFIIVFEQQKTEAQHRLEQQHTEAQHQLEQQQTETQHLLEQKDLDSKKLFEQQKTEAQHQLEQQQTETQHLLEQKDSDSKKRYSDLKKKLKYMKRIDSVVEFRRSVRINVIGKHGAGNSNLVRRLLGQNKDDVASTDGNNIARNILIRTSDGEWIVNKDETEKKERRRKIQHTGDMVDRKLKRNEFGSDRTRPSKKHLMVTEGKHTEQENMSFNENLREKQRKQTTRPASRESAVASNDISGKKRVVKSDTIKSDTKNDERIVGEMDKIIMEFKNERMKMISEGFVECSLWNFADQSDNYVTHKTFLTPNAIYLLVVDIVEEDANIDSFREYIAFWYDSIQYLCMDSSRDRIFPHVKMVCFHTDMNVDDLKNEYRKQIEDVIGRQGEANHMVDIHFISTNEYIEKDIKELKDSISKLAKDKTYFSEAFPTKWIELDTIIAILKESKESIISLPKIEELAAIIPMEKEDIFSCLTYQHKIGKIIFFDDISDFIVLEPNWLVRCIRCLVCGSKLNARNENTPSSVEWNQLVNTGVISEQLVCQLFETEPSLEFGKYKTYLLHLMDKFDIMIKQQCSDSDYKYYMSCMIEKIPTSIEIIQKRFTSEQSNYYTTPWLILEFEFLPISLTNHIVFHCIRKYPVCEVENMEKPVYEKKALFDVATDTMLLICFSKNDISFQIWQLTSVIDKSYPVVLDELYDIIKEWGRKYGENVHYYKKAKCCAKMSGRMCYEDLTSLKSRGMYFCNEHQVVQSADEKQNIWFQHHKTVE